MSPAASSAPNYDGGDGGRSADSTRRGEEMTPPKTGANDGEENSQPPADPGGLVGAKIVAAAMAATRLTPRLVSRRLRPRRRGDDDAGTVDSPFGGKVMGPTKKGANKGKENCPRSSAVKNLSLRGEGRPGSPGGVIGAKTMAAQVRPLSGLRAQRRGYGAHKDGHQGREDGRQGRRVELHAHRRGNNKKPSP